jgi:hypothetical protein
MEERHGERRNVFVQNSPLLGPLNPTTPLPALSSPSEGEERVAEGRERRGSWKGRKQQVWSAGL